MADRTCLRCGKEFRAPSYLRSHEKRKTPCAPILEQEDILAVYGKDAIDDPDFVRKKCRFCGRVLSSYTAMRRHVRDTCRIAPNARNGDTGMELLYEHTIRRQEARIKALEGQNAEILDMVKCIAKDGDDSASGDPSGKVVITGGTNLVNVDTSVNKTNVVINVFGAEGVEHITVDAIRKILQDAVSVSETPERMAEEAMFNAALLVYSDPEHPENLTCYLPNQRGDSALVHVPRADGTIGWEVQPVPVVLPKMGKKSVDALFDNQPFEDAEAYGPLLRELLENESRYVGGKRTLRPILVRNKDLLQRALETLPMAADTAGAAVSAASRA